MRELVTHCEDAISTKMGICHLRTGILLNCTAAGANLARPLCGSEFCISTTVADAKSLLRNASPSAQQHYIPLRDFMMSASRGLAQSGRRKGFGIQSRRH